MLKYLKKCLREIKKNRLIWFLHNTFKYKKHIFFITDFQTKSNIIERNSYNYIKKKYKDIFMKKYNLPTEKNNTIWFCWLQGLENAPRLVKTCYERLISFYPNRVKIITSNNYHEYISLPLYIINKFKKGYISYQHLSDIIRLELLCKYGGTWFDSTIFIQKKIPEFMLESDFFMFYHGDRNSVITYLNFFITSKSNNPILLAVRDFMLKAYKNNNHPIHYLQFSIATTIALEMNPDIERKIIKYSDVNVHLLQKELNEQFDYEKFMDILEVCPLQKLTNKIKIDNKKKTFMKFLEGDIHVR